MGQGKILAQGPLHSLFKTSWLSFQLHLIHYNTTLYESLELALGKPNGVSIIAIFIQVSRHDICIDDSSPSSILKKSGLLGARSLRHRAQSPEVIHSKSLWTLAITSNKHHPQHH
jgi:hypothetical protein